MNKTVVVSIVLLLSVVACNHVYREYEKASFPDYAWKFGQEVKFSPVIKDTSKKYTLTLGVRHVHGLQLDGLKVNVQTIAPSGKRSSADYVLVIRDVEGNYIGECAGDMCDVEMKVDDNLIFEETGDYTIVITHQVQTEKIPGIMEVGLILDENN